MKHRILILVFVILIAGCGNRRMPERQIVPRGYEGVLVTIYNQNGYPELPIVDGYIVHEYPASGIIVTSSPIDYGVATDETYEILEDGSRNYLPHAHKGQRIIKWSGTGTRSGKGGDWEYSLMGVGSGQFWDKHDGREYDKKVDQAIKAIRENELL